MLKLHGKLPIVKRSTRPPYLVTLTKNDQLASPLRESSALLFQKGLDASRFKTILLLDQVQPATSLGDQDMFQLSREYAYLDEGDILRVDPSSGSIRCLYRRTSPHNTILLTERCDHYCLMCSQPPIATDDSWLLDEAMSLIGMIPAETEALGISGGEPTLYGIRFIELLQSIKAKLPSTALDVLSNGRAFKDMAFAKQYAEVQHPDLLIGIPVYSDDPVRHDYVVQSRGAFDDTIRGILNLALRRLEWVNERA